MWNRKNGYRKVKVKMSTISDKPAILYLNKQQFICKDCQKSFTAETSEVKKNSNTLFDKEPKIQEWTFKFILGFLWLFVKFGAWKKITLEI